MDKSGRGRRVNVVDEPNEFEIGINSDSIFIIKVPDSRSLRVVSRSLFLAAVLLSLPSIAAIIRAASYAPPLYEADADSDASENLPLVLRDLMEEGLINGRHKGFVLASAAAADLRAHQVFDYIYAASFSDIELMGGAVRDGGLAVAPLGGDLSAELRLLRGNFKIVYLRRLEGKTVVAMRKSAAAKNSAAKQRVLCGIAPGIKESALKGLEEVYLEPPRSSKKSSYKFLPDLMKDPLDEYRRRFFIADESKALDWFYENYPMRGQEFQVYKMEVVREWKLEEMGVRAEDYVVMKAEAKVVEEMLRERSLCVVDELFLECREERGGGGERGRAYWECVALYGKIRDEGIAVHQWWF